jgi:hypothetical protein
LKAGKAYISSLGTTGLLIASSLLLLVVVGTLIAFDAWPSGESAAQPDTIAIAQTERAEVKKKPAAPSKTSATERAAERRAERAERRAAVKRKKRAAARDRSEKSDGSGGPSGGRPVRDGGGPDGGRTPSNGGGDDGSASSGGGGNLPNGGPIDVNSVPNTGSETIRQISSGVSVVSPEAGQIVQQTGDAVVETVNEVVDQVLPDLGSHSSNDAGLIP